MKIECVKDKLQKAVNSTERIVGKNLSLPILANIYIEAKNKKVLIRATNLDLGVEIIIPAIIEKEGSVTVKPQVLSNFLNNLNNEEKIIMEVEGENIKIKTSKGSTVINCDSAEDFPVLPSIKTGKKLSLNSGELIDGLKSVYFSASHSDIKPEISSVYIYLNDNNLFFVSTDSFRLAEKKISLKSEVDFDQVIIPLKNVLEIIRVFENHDESIDIFYDNNQISLYLDNIYLTSRLIDGIYPDYRQIMPTEFKTKVKIKKEDLIEILKLSNVFINKLNQVNLSVKPLEKIIEIKSENQDIGGGVFKINGDIEGDEDINMNFNIRYINECLGSISSKEIWMNFNEINKPLFIKGDNDSSFSYIIMPLNR